MNVSEGKEGMRSSMKRILKAEDIENMINNVKTEESIISIEVKDFDENLIVEYHPNKKVNSASCIKVPILIAALHKVQMGKLQLDQIIDFSNIGLEVKNTIYHEIEKKATVLELLTFMIIDSDNLATDVIVNLFGFDYYNQFFKNMGLVDTEMNRYMGIDKVDTQNYTSNRDMYHLHKQLFQETILNKELCDLAKSLLHKQRKKSASQRYIYEDIDIYHKTGGLEYLQLRNDCGYFKINDKVYYFGFFMEKMNSIEDASILIGKMFKYIYHQLI